MFYRNLFAAFCFAFFVIALSTRSPLAFLATLLCGALSRTAARKDWPNPHFIAARRESGTDSGEQETEHRDEGSEQQ
ncbi:MAG: hypothetical protein K9L28_06160 [Synergistales bacterium]|nr:hypothetical protein [Synergistales bacterium]